jgi:hypothetical protein
MEPHAPHSNRTWPARRASVGRAARATWRVALAVLVAAIPGSLHPQTGSGVPGTDSLSDTDGVGPYGPGVPPLFAFEAPLELRIEADFRRIRRDRDDENPEHPGLVYVLAADGSESEWPVEVRTRGNFRLQTHTCDFPPIRLDFPTSEVEGGVFEGQDKLKLVTHCRDRYEPNVLREYLAYRIYSALTPASFRVRLARVTYHDTSGHDDPMIRLAFLIEMEEALAARLGGRAMEDVELTDGLHPGRVSAEDAMNVDLFQFMVGNTDCTMYFPSDNGGLHNIVAVEREGTTVVPVPYDFDWTGLVDASYARPNPQLNLRRVTDRMYRGFCRANIDYAATYEAFLDRRATIDGLVSGFETMAEDERRSVARYLDDFWETLGDEGRARYSIERACRSY